MQTIIPVPLMSGIERFNCKMYAANSEGSWVFVFFWIYIMYVAEYVLKVKLVNTIMSSIQWVFSLIFMFKGDPGTPGVKGSLGLRGEPVSAGRDESAVR